VLKKLPKAHAALAELKGVLASIPNGEILISTLSFQEAKDSSAIENIITTHDELYRSDFAGRQFVTVAAKEVHLYAAALRSGFERVRASGLLLNHDILHIQACIEENRAGFRKLPGTELRNERTGEVIYTPPQHPDDIVALMSEPEGFINDDSLSDCDPLVKMALIHHRFESIHPSTMATGARDASSTSFTSSKRDCLEVRCCICRATSTARKAITTAYSGKRATTAHAKSGCYGCLKASKRRQCKRPHWCKTSRD